MKSGNHGTNHGTSHGIKQEWALLEATREEFEKNYPYLAYEGGLEADEDPADYVNLSIKAVRLG